MNYVFLGVNVFFLTMIGVNVDKEQTFYSLAAYIETCARTHLRKTHGWLPAAAPRGRARGFCCVFRRGCGLTALLQY
jgi:hypothetical protein